MDEARNSATATRRRDRQGLIDARRLSRRQVAPCENALIARMRDALVIAGDALLASAHGLLVFDDREPPAD